MRKLKFRAVVIDSDDIASSRLIAPVGRVAQTLEALAEAGSKGITAQDVGGWAVRLSHYIFKLRSVYGLSIKTSMESHGGTFPGKHGRYVLLTQIRIEEQDSEAA
jgi:hypothetical protein